MLKYRIIKIFWILLFCNGILSAQVEICDNGVDDDGDTLVDLNDPDCVCALVEPVSLIPNPSFEEMNCCPQDRNELDCATDWIQASDPTTDYVHTCGWLGWEEFPPPQPFPDGEGVMGFRDGRVRRSTEIHEPFWKEYAGACLLSPLEQGVLYRFEFDLGFIDLTSSPPINISFFGTSNCDNLPFGVGDENFGCPSNSSDWIKLSDVFVAGGSTNTWVSSFIEITPEQDIYAIAIGPDCPPISEAVSTYYFFDNLLLADQESFSIEIEEVTHPCRDDFVIAVDEEPNVEYQWYKSGVALPGEVTATVIAGNYGEGIFQVRTIAGGVCRVSENFEYRIPIITSMPEVRICEGESYEFGGSFLSVPGFYLDTFLNQNNCDSIISLELEVIGQQFTSVEASILAGETYEIGGNQFTEPGEYPLTFSSSLGCDSLVLLDLTNFEVFIPTAFSPNFDGINDYFQPFSEFGKITSVEMKIYDRWGGLRYSGDRWDGSELNPGVYVYMMTLEFDYGGVKEYAGSVTLLR